MSSNYYNSEKEKRLRRITAVNFLSSISLDGVRRFNNFGIQASRRPSKRTHEDIENEKAKEERETDRVSFSSESDIKLSSSVGAPRILSQLNPFQPHRERGR